MRTSRSATVLFYSICIAVSLSSVLPFLWVLLGSFKPDNQIRRGQINLFTDPVYSKVEVAGDDGKPALKEVQTGVKRSEYTLANYRATVSGMSGFWSYYRNTIIVTLAATFLTILFGSLAAFAFAHYSFRGERALFLLFLITLMVPGEVTLIGRFELMLGLRLLDTISGLTLCYLAGGLMLVVFLMRNVFRGVPKDVIAAARIDGASDWQVFWEVMVPMGRNGILAATIITALNYWNEFTSALTFTVTEHSRTLPVGIMLLQQQCGAWDVGALFSTVLFSFLPMILIFIVLQKYIVAGLSQGAVKG